MMPHNKKDTSCENGSMITLSIDTKEKVNIFYDLALSLGATDEGLPGPRNGLHYYAYFRDLDGNKICVFC